jgi:hypothetical protein
LGRELAADSAAFAETGFGQFFLDKPMKPLNLKTKFRQNLKHDRLQTRPSITS